MKYFISRKDRIILSAIEIIDELGVQKLSTKELAFRQGVNESALYRHFKNKDAIILGVLDYFSQFDNAIYNSVIQKEISSRDKVYEYVKSFMEYYEGYPAITAILLSCEILSHEEVAKEKIASILNERFDNMISLIEESQNNSEITKNINSRELALVIVGYCNQVILDWRMHSFNHSFKEEVLNTVNTLLSI
jgi:TetR/AcrR family transcriptional regulator, fatty acid metabolism regulator protein